MKSKYKIGLQNPTRLVMAVEKNMVGFRIISHRREVPGTSRNLSFPSIHSLQLHFIWALFETKALQLKTPLISGMIIWVYYELRHILHGF